ncbi:MAG: hypothetical protein ACLVFK_04550 [Evtepia gabavorous]
MGTWSVRLPPGKIPIGTRGPGETQLETDRRHIRRKIASSPRTWRRSAGFGRSSGTAGRRMRSPWWPLWAIPTPASPPSSMP